MATQISALGYTSGVTDLYAYYVEQSLADYVADKVLFVEGTGADAGRYLATVDESKGTSIVAFRGAAQPSGWDQAVPTLGWGLLIEQFKADAELGTAPGGMAANVLAIKPKTDLIGSGTAFTAVPVSELGQLDKIIIGDDYLKANSRSFKWTFDAIPGFTIGTCTGVFGVKASSNPALSFTSTATTTDITDLGGGRWQVEFEVAKTLTSALPQGTYDWSVEIVQAGTEITVAKSKDRQSPVRLMVKQT